MKTKPLILGVLLAVGTFDSSVLFVTALLIVWAVWESRRELPPAPALLLGGSIAATAPLAVIPWHPLVISTVVVSLAVLGRSIRKQWDPSSFFLGLLIGVAPQLLAAVATWGDQRPELLSLNASQVAQTGLMFWFILPTLSIQHQRFACLAAAIQMGVSVSRAPILVAMVYLLFKPTRLRIALFFVISLAFVAATISQNQGVRLTWANLIHSANIRSGLITDSDSVMVVVVRDGYTSYEPTTDPERFTKPRLNLTGYGNGNYIAATNIVRPHNMPILLGYEMGVLAIVPFALFVWMVFTRRIPFALAISLFLLWQVVEEPAGRFEGMFTTAAVLIALWKRPMWLSDSVRYAREPTRKAA